MDKYKEAHERMKKLMVEDADCLIWTGGLACHGGHPKFTARGLETTGCRRIVYRAVHGRLPGKMQVTTKCGNRLCLNPEHLELITKAEVRRRQPPNALRVANSAKAMREKHAKLTMEKAREIRESTETFDALAAKYGVNRSRIAKIKNGEAWQDFSSPMTSMFTSLVRNA